ncbi:MAG TPA: bifunctional transaldolase/phosoglucose isomerase [Pyrinomonadaceae bacterium]|nr:bifunctional transaldolase/phosoglucose isomerase [Pyrinomonadaceae bacterium]
MDNAGSKVRRETDPYIALSVSPGEQAEAVNAALEEASRAHVIERIWNKDAALWKSEPAHQKIIANSLGWLTVASEMLAVEWNLKTFAEGVNESGFQHVMVCGMGGSSLCPEVLRQTFGRQAGFPELLVLDSTDPDTINRFKELIDITKCLFVIASKSGTTTEPNAFHRYWYNEVAQHSDTPGDSFVTITDPGSQMADIAAREGFRRIFLNQPDIGGRYSALSYFGMVPATVMGVDTARLLPQTHSMVVACAAQVPVNQNPAAMLGAVMAECARAGRDKLTIVTDQKLAALGLWVEQLIAESTGKEGKGIVPIVGEPLGAVSDYGNDRLFVSISVGPSDDQTNSRLKALEAAGHPVVYRELADVYDLGAEFFLWEMATAFAGWRLGINPFDQPNVQESKDATKALLEKYKQDGKLPEQPALASDGQLTVYGVAEGESSPALSVPEALRTYCAKIKPGDYVALLAYIEETPDVEAAIREIRTNVRKATRCATTNGFGPRFLHSTGQLHKGGPDSGVFIQITAPDKVDFPVPEAPYTFSVLKDAQALGDFQSLLKHGRRAIRVDLGDNVVAGLKKLQELIDSILNEDKRAGASPPS